MTFTLKMTPEEIGFWAGMATGIVGPLRQTEQDGAITWYWDGLVQSWATYWLIAVAVAMLGWGFGALGVDWLVGTLIGLLTHIVVAYLMGWIIEWMGP